MKEPDAQQPRRRMEPALTPWRSGTADHGRRSAGHRAPGHQAPPLDPVRGGSVALGHLAVPQQLVPAGIRGRARVRVPVAGEPAGRAGHRDGRRHVALSSFRPRRGGDAGRGPRLPGRQRPGDRPHQRVGGAWYPRALGVVDRVHHPRLHDERPQHPPEDVCSPPCLPPRWIRSARSSLTCAAFPSRPRWKSWSSIGPTTRRPCSPWFPRRSSSG